MPTVASVYILDVPYQLDRAFDYFIPVPLRGEVFIGGFVHVPFGGGNRPKLGLVVALHNDAARELKPVVSTVALLNENVALNHEMLGLCAFLKEHTFCTIGEAVRTVIPPAALTRLEEVLRASGRPDAFNSRAQELIYERIASDKVISIAKLTSVFGNDTPKLIAGLLASGAVVRDVRAQEPSNMRKLSMISLDIDIEEARTYIDRSKPLRSEAYRAVLCALLERPSHSAPAPELPANITQLRAMRDRGLVAIEEVDVFRDPYADKVPPEPDNSPLTDEQTAADETIAGLIAAGEPKAALLYGVTGSGKTRVIKAAIDRVTALGRQVIVMVPEISLTPQTVGFFRSYYGERIAVLHSALSAGERFDAWRRMKCGEVDICIGTRSAAFAPFDNIGMIVIDEEQEHTYKSDMNPKYHARDIARYRCAKHRALMLLSSATPSVESFYKAKTGIYTLIELTSRYGEATLPETAISDLRADAARGSSSPIGRELALSLARTLERGEQAVLFINRRGYNSYLSCGDCGEVLTCPHCSVSLTFHTNGATKRGDGETIPGSQLKRGYLLCHYCGYRAKVPEVCPECGNPHLGYIGFGTQKVEDELHTLFPDAKVMRLDADTTKSKFAFEELLDSFRAGDADIMLGTQMVTKGHDFPNVTLVGVLLADASLYLEDYKAGERAFALMTQVIGRAGRADKPGYAVIQTNNPEHPVLALASRQDYSGFYENEIAIRRAYTFPPFCDIVLITLSGVSEPELLTAAGDYNKVLRGLLEHDAEYRDVQLIMFGPIEAPIYKLNERFRLRFVFKCRSNAATRALLARMMREEGKKFGSKITITTDINPNSL